jgi:hypothetical protein
MTHHQFNIQQLYALSALYLRVSYLSEKRRKLLDDLKERRWYSHLKEEALDRTM